jgi:hypothetical protein
MLSYGIVMADQKSSGGLAGPGLNPPSPSAFALELDKKARSRAESDLAQLERALCSPTQLLQLNTAEDYSQLPATKLTADRILRSLARNPEPAAGKIIGLLCTNEVFLAEPARVECLLGILPSVRPLPEPALALLRQSTFPDSDHLDMAVRALVEIGEKPALAILAEQVLNPGQDPEAVRGWLRDPVLRHRYDRPVLEMCLNLLSDPRFDPDLKNSLVEVLFDYRPKEWYVPSQADAGGLPKPPSLRSASRASRELLEQIGVRIATDSAVTTENRALAQKALRGK